MPNPDTPIVATDLFAYSEWLDAQGLVVSDRDGDPRTHEQLVADFLAARD